MTDREKAKQRFFASDKEITNFIPQCAVCINVDGMNCKALKGKRPEKYYLDERPDYQKCPHFQIDKNAHLAEVYKKFGDK